ncbi:unnamed protein product [Boreogadus saida]
MESCSEPVSLHTSKQGFPPGVGTWKRLAERVERRTAGERRSARGAVGKVQSLYYIVWREEGGVWREEGGVWREEGGSGGKREESGGKREESGGKREESGGKREESGGKREESGGKREDLVPPSHCVRLTNG